MERVLDKLPVSDQLKSALVGDAGILAKFLQTAIAFEKNQRGQFEKQCAELGILTSEISASYLSAVKYANGLF